MTLLQERLQVSDNFIIKYDSNRAILVIMVGNIVLDKDKDIYRAGAGLRLVGNVFNVSAPRCDSDEKLIWDGAKFECSTDIVGELILQLSGNILSISGGNSVTFTNWDTDVTDDVRNLTDLQDVTISSANVAQVLRYDGSVWVNSLLSFTDLSDTPSNYGTGGYLLQTDGSGSIVYVDPMTMSLGSISQHSDVDTSTTTLSVGDLLRWDGVNWVPVSSDDYLTNIYTSDGTLAGNRNVDLGGNSLSFGTDKLYIDGSSGNVGIGTTSPGAKLKVNGSIKISPLNTPLEFDWHGRNIRVIASPFDSSDR